MKTAIYKARVEISEDGIKITSYANQKLGTILWALNEAVQNASNELNGKNDWKEYYIHFEHNGQRYKQIKSNDLCKGCIFDYKKDGVSCQHPHYLDGTKGKCTGRIYVKE